MDRLTLALEWFLNPDHAPLLIARERGWLAEAGIELEIVEPEEHLDPLAALEDGSLDLAITEPIHLVQDCAKGAAIQGLARFLHTNGGVMYRRDRVQRPRDMVGKRLQYPGAPGPGGLAIVRTMIERDGGPKNAQLTPINNGFMHTDALLEDKADLATLVFYNFEVLEARARGLDVDYFALRDFGIPDFCQLILVATPAWIEERHDLASRFLRVLRRAVDVVREDPRTAEAEWWRASGQDAEGLGAEIYQATTRCFTADFSMSDAYYEQLSGWLVETGQIDSPVAPKTAWTNALAFV